MIYPVVTTDYQPFVHEDRVVEWVDEVYLKTEEQHEEEVKKKDEERKKAERRKSMFWPFE